MPQQGDLNHLLVGAVGTKADFWQGVSDDSRGLKNSFCDRVGISCNVKTLQDKWFSVSQKKFEKSARSAEGAGVNQAKNGGRVGSLQKFWHQQCDHNVLSTLPLPHELADITLTKQVTEIAFQSSKAFLLRFKSHDYQVELHN